jgi:phosphoenolpyruvate synthase/pyruvate phosphate dikinase
VLAFSAILIPVFKTPLSLTAVGVLAKILSKEPPDEWMVFKPTLENAKLNPILKRHCGRKEFTMIYADKSDETSAENTIINKPTSIENKSIFIE